MKRTKRSISRLTLLATAGLVLLNGWAMMHLQGARQSAQLAKSGAKEVQVLADKIVALRNRAQRAAVSPVSDADLSRSVEEACRAAQIPAGQLSRIAPQSPHRYQDSGYLEQSIDLDLDGLTLPQLLTCLLDLTTKNEGVNIKSLRLTAPRESSDRETWKAEVTLSYFIYSPINRQRIKGET